MWGFDAETTLFGVSMISFVIGTLLCDEVGNPPQGSFGGNPNRIVSASEFDQNWKKRTKGSIVSHFEKGLYDIRHFVSLYVFEKKGMGKATRIITPFSKIDCADHFYRLHVVLTST